MMKNLHSCYDDLGLLLKALVLIGYYMFLFDSLISQNLFFSAEGGKPLQNPSDAY